MPSYNMLPKAPLLFRDGRPFGADAAYIAETLPFPLPSTVAGAFRTAYGDTHEVDFAKSAEELLKVDVAGPLMTQVDTRGGTKKVLVPAPADALCLNEDEGKIYYRLSPMALSDDTEGMDLPDNLCPIVPTTKSKSKPASAAPAYWHLDRMVDWLSNDTILKVKAERAGVERLPIEVRTHLGVDRKTLTAEHGRLFETSGLDFGEQKFSGKKNNGWCSHHYGLLVHSTAELNSTYRTLGGESRLACIERDDTLWPACPEKLKKELCSSRGIRLQLVTPAIFDHGWKPGWLDDNLTGVLPGVGDLRVKLRAAAVPRWQAVSGWDMRLKANGKKQRGPKAVRRMVPAGAVYWFEVLSGSLSAAGAIWLKSISDQQANDGFGLAVPGVWNS